MQRFHLFGHTLIYSMAISVQRLNKNWYIAVASFVYHTYRTKKVNGKTKIQIQIEICGARLTDCPVALTKCQNARWNR